MKSARIFSILGLLIFVISLIVLLSACEGDTDSGGTTDSGNNDPEGNGDVVESSPTPDPADLFPEFIVLHPDAFDIEVTEASGSFIYFVPMMVKEATEYLLAEHEAVGWETLGKPTVMGHLASLTMKMGDDRLTLSLQDNELTESTRVQILLMQQ